jgi:magnesium transporter
LGAKREQRWIDITDPSKEEISRIIEEHHLPQGQIEHSLDKRERPRIDEQDDITLVILRVPHHKEKGRRAGSWSETTPIGFLLREESLATISPRPTIHFLQEIHRRRMSKASWRIS